MPCSNIHVTFDRLFCQKHHLQGANSMSDEPDHAKTLLAWPAPETKYNDYYAKTICVSMFFVVYKSLTVSLKRLETMSFLLSTSFSFSLSGSLSVLLVGGGGAGAPNIASSWAAWIWSSRLDYIRKWIQFIYQFT